MRFLACPAGMMQGRGPMLAFALVVIISGT